MIFHFTRKSFLVTTVIPRRHGNYGSTTTFLGVFNRKRKAEAARLEFIKNFNKDNNHRKHPINESHVAISVFCPDKLNEIVLSEIYE